eukprot:CAMPEP_0113457230 /NCGR_PEP_ID=MMETSP0014_2-20120614/9299_1 /TAXON_ID=2857 /ORGANISM="Nitzschia sp." /LENGTH=471 /DNA_ID=CAMNT_0000348715 /DNA_START=247 /DNA_END=1662 /DNA_ORIENTATION=+ /assembly_acc=CAM_ASM_000159
MMSSSAPINIPTPLTAASSSDVAVPATMTSNNNNNGNNKRRTATTKKSGGVLDSVPLFLRKSFDLIEHADPEIVSWSEDGKSFVVKDVKKFTDDVIPSYFKHNNFSSFVRQLNFYGFRKVKDENLKINNEPSIEDKYWKFRHPMFLKGRPDLLIEIKKATQPEVVEKQEVDALKAEVMSLKTQLTTMSRNMDALTRVVHDLMQKDEQRQIEQQQQQQSATNDVYIPLDHDGGSSSKKRRISSYNDEVPVALPSPIPSTIQSQHNNNPATLLPLDVTSSHPVQTLAPPPMPPKAKVLDVEQSIGSLGELDDELLATLMALDDDERIALCTKELSLPDTHVSLPANTSNPPDPKLVERLRDSLASLPKNMQELFVERLVKAIASPEAFQDQVEAVNALAAAAAAEAQKRLKEGTDHAGDLMEALDHEQKVELATAVLGSFLARYGTAIPQNPNTGTSQEDAFDVDASEDSMKI